MQATVLHSEVIQSIFIQSEIILKLIHLPFQQKYSFLVLRNMFVLGNCLLLLINIADWLHVISNSVN